MVGFISSFWIYPSGLRIARTFAQVGALVPLMLILRRLVAPPALPGLYALAGFFLLDRIRDLFIGLPLFERYFLLVEVLAAAAVLAWFVQKGRSRHVTDELGAAMRRAVPSCDSDQGRAPGNYAVCIGSQDFNQYWSFFGQPKPSLNGAIVYTDTIEGRTSFRDIKDGTSSTLMVIYRP